MNTLETKNTFVAIHNSLKKNDLDPALRLKLEQKQLFLMKNFAQNLSGNYPFLAVKRPGAKTPESNSRLFAKKVFYYIAMPLGLLQDAIGNFVFGLNVFSLLTFLTYPLIITLSITLSLLNSILFYGFQATVFWEVLGFKSDNRSSLFQCYNQQGEVLNGINAFLFDIKAVASTNATIYKEYAQFALFLNQDLADKQKKLHDFQEPLKRKILRLFITGVGMLTTASASFFFTTSFLTMLSPSILLNPLSWILVGLMMSACASFYLSMQGSGITNLVTPEFTKFEALKTMVIKTEQDFLINYTLLGKAAVVAQAPNNDFYEPALHPMTLIPPRAEQPSDVKAGNAMSFFARPANSLHTPTEITQEPGLTFA